MFGKKCKKCGFGDNSRESKFCAQCGERLEGGTVKCGNCSAEIDSGSQFCAMCGKPNAESASPFMVDNRWARKVDDFATKVEVADLAGVLKKELIVEQGTKALLFINGAFADTLMPGKYDMGSVSDKLRNFDLRRRATAVLVDAADIQIGFKIVDIWTKDPVKIDVSCNVVVQLSEPNFFFVNMMKGKQNYSIHELKNFLFDEIRNALRETIGQRSVNELSTDMSLKKEFEARVETHLRTTYQRNGLSFIQFRTIEYTYPHIDEIKHVQEDLFIQITEKEARLEGRKRFFDVINEEELQAIIEDTNKAENVEKRIEVLSRLRAAANSDKMDELKSEDDLKAFILEMDKGQYLRDDERDALVKTFQEHAMSRQQLLEKLKLEHDIERYRLNLIKEEDLDPALIESRLNKKRMEYEAELAEDQARKAADRQDDIKDELAKLDILLKKAKTEAEIEAIKREQDRLDAEQNMLVYEKMKAIQRRDEYERMIRELEKKEKEQKLELERLAKLSQMSMEALIITADTDAKAAMLAELKKTDILKGMTDEQILAMAAKDSPEVGKAFAEKFKAMDGALQQKFYERMLADKDKSSEELRQTVMDMFKTSMEAVSSQRRPDVIYPPPGSSGLIMTGVNVPGSQSAGEAVICTKCHSKVPSGQKYCTNCGNKLF